MHGSSHEPSNPGRLALKGLGMDSQKRPLVLFVSRYGEVRQYLETFIGARLESLHADCINLHLDLGEESLAFDADGLPRDDALVAGTRIFVESLGIVPALTIIGTRDGPRTLYRRGINGAPLGFVPMGTDNGSLAEAISTILEATDPTPGYPGHTRRIS